MDKKYLILVSLVLVFTLVFSFNTFAETEIEYWTTQTEEERAEVIRDIARRFEEDNQNYTVNVVTVQENDIPTKIAAGMAADKLPEVIEVGAENILNLGAEGMIDTEAVDEVIEVIGRDDLYEGAVEMLASPEEGQFGIPMHGWVQGIWYREDLFEERGLEPPTTWDNILEAAEAFNNPDEQEYGIVIGTDKDSYARQTFTQYALSNNSRIFDAEGNLVFNSPEMVETLEFYKDLAQYTPPGPEGWRDARDLYLSGRVPMMMYSTYIMDDIGLEETGYEGEKGSIVPDLVDKTAFANKITKETGASFGQIVGLTLLKGNEEDKMDGAKLFAKYLMSDQQYIDFLHTAPGGMNPTRKSIANDERYLENQVINVWGSKAADIAKSFENIGKFGYVEGKVFPKIGQITSQFIVGQTIMKMTENGWSAERAAEWGHEEMEDALE